MAKHVVVAASNLKKSRLYFVSRSHYEKSNPVGTPIPHSLRVYVRPDSGKDRPPEDYDGVRLVALYAYDVKDNKYRALIWCGCGKSGKSWKYFPCEQDGEEW